MMGNNDKFPRFRTLLLTRAMNWSVTKAEEEVKVSLEYCSECVSPNNFLLLRPVVSSLIPAVGFLGPDFPEDLKPHSKCCRHSILLTSSLLLCPAFPSDEVICTIILKLILRD